MKFSNNFVRLISILYRKRIFFPVAFLALELAFCMTLNWQLFGEKYEFNDQKGEAGIIVHNPLIVISAVHSDRLTHPYGELSGETPAVKFYSPRTIIKALCFLASLVFAYIGIFISVLWIRRHFAGSRLTMIRWWMWPVACIGAHIVFYMIGNTSVNNLL